MLRDAASVPIIKESVALLPYVVAFWSLRPWEFKDRFSAELPGNNPLDIFAIETVAEVLEEVIVPILRFKPRLHVIRRAPNLRHHLHHRFGVFLGCFAVEFLSLFADADRVEEPCIVSEVCVHAYAFGCRHHSVMLWLVLHPLQLVDE